jgi:hypothetical protein
MKIAMKIIPLQIISVPQNLFVLYISAEELTYGCYISKNNYFMVEMQKKAKPSSLPQTLHKILLTKSVFTSKILQPVNMCWIQLHRTQPKGKAQLPSRKKTAYKNPCKLILTKNYTLLLFLTLLFQPSPAIHQYRRITYTEPVKDS